MKTVKEVLVAVDKLLNKPERHTVNFFARDKNNKLIDPLSEDATCWCFVGAIRKVMSIQPEDYGTKLYVKTYQHILKTSPTKDILKLNDLGGYDAVKKYLKQQIKELA